MRPARAGSQDHFFRVLYSFSGLSASVVTLMGIVLVIATGAIEWATEIPFPDDVVFVLIIGGVTFHGSMVAGLSLAVLAGLARFISTAASAARAPVAGPAATIEGLALLALLLGIVLLASALHRAIRALQEQALRDPLTGAFNTRGFMDAAERERLRALRHEHPLTIAYFDIDGMKKLNDAAGHQAGDRLLLGFVSAVAVSIRPYDIFARIGGDEFVLILPATDRREALSVITRIRAQLIGHLPPLSVSVGAVTYTAPTDQVETMLQAADRLMYQAKQGGGNRLVGEVRSADPDTKQRTIELVNLVERH